ncbi:WD40-repeat-containing domain protein [Lentinula aciculospora]|uniref:WD40-repeat-containing domain protein n=1 Tax=Lentinula aciculospora TaxID=153920 RepID=A0A9W9APX2_9AGAR|nr:WD40-repeat-containing domain protein [Lentinula aciculospora]
MRLTESEETSPSPSIAGPSSKSFDYYSTSNGRTPSTNGKGFQSSFTNGNGVDGSSGTGTSGSNGVVVEKYGKSAPPRVNLPGHLLYEDLNVDREEFVRLLLQSLRDVGYIESAATLEAESGYSMEEPQVKRFREYILSGMWSKAEDALSRLGIVNEDSLWDAKFLINKQKYLELLEAQKTAAALHVLRSELAPSSSEPAQLHALSSLLMCTEPEDVRQRARWDGALGRSRQQLLLDLHHSIPPSIMIPQRRFVTLLQQAHRAQVRRCIYHNTPLESTPFSLFNDHECNKDGFPSVTTTVLLGHTDEVWSVEWSHDGAYLASGGQDKTAIIWSMGPDSRKWEAHLILRDHLYPVHSIAWSSDDAMLLTGAEHCIKLWDAKTGSCIRTLDEHTETVTAFSWLPDGSGFLSGALDRKIIQWDAEGRKMLSWGLTDIRVTDLAVTPDLSRVVAIGRHVPTSSESSMSRGARSSGSSGDGSTSNPSGNSAPTNGITPIETRIVIYRLSTRQVEFSIKLDGELTSVKISQDSQYALISHSPDEIQLWDLRLGRLSCKFTGQRQGRHVIRSCFAGLNDSFVVSGSEDGNVYVWHRETGDLLEVLSGHGPGSVNSVAWNPANERMFASCSDDNSIRIWEAPSPETSLDESGHTDFPVSYNTKGKGKTRQLDGEVENAGMAGSSTRL